MDLNPFESFVRETMEAVASATDPKVVTDAVAESLRRLLAAPFFLADRYRAPGKDGIARHELHREPEGRFCVHTVVWAPKQATPIHDHTGWGVIAAVSGRLVSTTYRRLDDGATPGFASLSESARALVSDVSFTQVRPGEEEIHKLENPFRDPAVTLHVFGEETPQQNYYDTRVKSLMSVTSAWTIGV